MVKRSLLIAILWCCGAGAWSAPSVNFSLPSPAVAGVYIEDLATGDVLVDINGDKAFVPASITKSVTSASVLTQYDPSYRFATEVVVNGKVKGEILDGDIVVKVVGDPTLGSMYFEEYGGIADSIAAHVSALGVTAVKGSVVIDKGNFVDEPTPEGWLQEDLAWPYGAGHYAATYRDNKFVLTMPGKKSLPEIPGLVINHSPARYRMRVERRRGNETIYTKGTPRRKGESVTLANPRPGATLAADVRRHLERAGIKIGAKVLNKDGEEKTIYTHYSPVLQDILQSLMFRSDNTMAEGVLRILAPGESRESALEREMMLWELRDIDTEQIVLEDGSGLSRGDRLTPYFMADVLVWMASHYRAPEYASLFPRAGYDGTMKSFMGDSPLVGRLALKTGSMKGVQTYAGYLLAEDGLPSHVVVVMVNNFRCGRAKVKAEVEKLLLGVFGSIDR